MSGETRDTAETAPVETPIRYKANAVIDALDEFLIAPSPSKRSTAMAAINDYLAEAEKVTASATGMSR